MKALDFVEQYEEKHFPLPKANLWDKIRFWFDFYFILFYSLITNI